MDKIVIAMKISQVKEILNSVFEEDESLKYALATNLAKYGRPQSKKSDKPSKLTKGLEKKREKHVKDLKKSMDEKVDLVHVMDKDGKMFGTGERVSTSGDKTLVRFDGSTEKEYPTSQVKTVKEQDMGSPFPIPDLDDKGYIAARKLIDQLRLTTFRKLHPDELESFRREIASAFDMTLKEGEKTYSPDDISDKDKEIMKKFLAILEPEGKPYYGSTKDPQKEEKKPDRCLRIARRKIPQSSAYRSGLIVKCRKGMIWKKEK